MASYLFRLLAFCVIVCNPYLVFANDQYQNRHKYWDYSRTAPFSKAGNCKETLANFANLNPQYMHPKLMALGDSLYNGVQSLRINWWLSEWSAPNLVAIRLGLIEEFRADRTGRREFFSPQYPDHGNIAENTRNFGFSLEDVKAQGHLTGLIRLRQLIQEQTKNIDDLRLYIPPNGRLSAENLSFSGATTSDLLYYEAREFEEMARAERPKIRPSSLLPNASAFGSYFTYANASFVLNPTDDPCWGSLTPIEQVEIRRPERLLINIGSNNGLYAVGFMGKSLEEKLCYRSKEKITTCKMTIAELSKDVFLKDITLIVDRLSRLKDMKFVYINNLAYPSQVANITFSQSGRGLRAGLAIAGNRKISAENIARADEHIKLVNSKLRRCLRMPTKPPRVPNSFTWT